MDQTQQLWLASQLIKYAAANAKMTGGGILTGGLLHGGMGADAVRKGMMVSNKANMPFQRLQSMGKGLSKLFKPQSPFNAVQPGRLSELARVKAMYPAFSTQNQMIAPLRARYGIQQ
jgi:hypothetical protein